MATEYKTHTIALILGAAFSLGGACDSTGGQGSDEAARETIPTAYFDKGEFDRTICAMGHPDATYYVAITAKKWKFGDDAGACKTFIENLLPVTPNQINSELCVNLGLDFKVLEGGVQVCVNDDAPDVGIPLYCHTFSKLYEQVNYNVADWNGEPLRTSGWQPPPGNGCPRGESMW